MSIIKAVDRAYTVMKERKWDTIYWCIDLHGVCLESNYQQGGYKWINDDVLEGLREIVATEEGCIILWSSVHESEKQSIKDFFLENGIIPHAFNRNPWERDTQVSSFKEKFYFSILLDDKAGFDPDTDWKLITQYLKNRRITDV